jgi:uncharacterized protein (DUF4415 family)
MRKKEHIVRASAEQIQAMRRRGEVHSDWAAAEQMTQAEVERRADEDEGPLPPDWENSVELGIPEPAQAVHIRFDAEVLRWFKARGPGYQTRINAVLRAFVRSRKRAEASQSNAKQPPTAAPPRSTAVADTATSYRSPPRTSGSAQ